ncbi:MAG: ATP-grasp fold amidoligase family protein, partial [bacterium]
MIIKKIINVMLHPFVYIRDYGRRGYFNWMPTKIYLRICYRATFGNKLNFKDPKSYNEKLQWLKIHHNYKSYSHLVDKYEVKKHIAKTIGSEYTIKTYGVYNTFEEIDFSKLPNAFVLKCTHDSGSVIVCENKNKFNYNQAKTKIKKHLLTNHYYRYREPVYKYIKPRIICEELISKNHENLLDFKFFCFNGEVKYIQVDFNRFSNHTRNIYTPKWHLTDYTIKLPSG